MEADGRVLKPRDGLHALVTNIVNVLAWLEEHLLTVVKNVQRAELAERHSPKGHGRSGREVRSGDEAGWSVHMIDGFSKTLRMQKEKKIGHARSLTRWEKV